jgi:hypothetical protein
MIWVGLVLVSAGSFVADGFEAKVGVTALLLVAAAAKFLMVGWQYMALRSAHLAWRMVFVLFLTGFTGFAYWISAAGLSRGL